MNANRRCVGLKRRRLRLNARKYATSPELWTQRAYPSGMQTLRRFRKLIALVALMWLPMTVFAQVCATQAVVAAIGGMGHPGLVQPGDLPQHFSHANAVADADVVTIVVDAETFWRSVDAFDSGCDMQSVCAFAGLAVVTSSLPAGLAFSNACNEYACASLAFVTRSLVPDTPPPRLAL